MPLARILAEIEKNPLLAGVTFTGGEPFCQAEAFCALAEKIEKMGLNIVTFSGTCGGKAACLYESSDRRSLCKRRKRSDLSFSRQQKPENHRSGRHQGKRRTDAVAGKLAFRGPQGGA